MTENGFDFAFGFGEVFADLHLGALRGWIFGLDLDQQADSSLELFLRAHVAVALFPGDDLARRDQFRFAVTVGVKTLIRIPTRSEGGLEQFRLRLHQHDLFIGLAKLFGDLLDGLCFVIQHGFERWAMHQRNIQPLRPGMPDIENGIVVETRLQDVVPFGRAVAVAVMRGREP